MKTLIHVLVLTLVLPLLALENTQANREREVERYLKATPPKELFEDMAEQMAKNMPAAEQKNFKALLIQHLDIEAVTKAMRESMVKHFTADELKALADFYGSEVGKSAMKKFGVYMADVMPTIQQEILKAQAKLSKEKK